MQLSLHSFHLCVHVRVYVSAKYGNNDGFRVETVPELLKVSLLSIIFELHVPVVVMFSAVDGVRFHSKYYRFI